MKTTSGLSILIHGVISPQMQRHVMKNALMRMNKQYMHTPIQKKMSELFQIW